MARRFVQGPLARFAEAAGHRMLLALGRTWRVRHVGGELVSSARFATGPVLYVFTHGVLLPLAYTHRDREIQVLISESRDGEIITRITGRLGFGSVRGSSSRGGGRAVIRMGARGKAGYDLAITPDGPRGPRGRVSPGVAWVSARGELPIVPVGVSADRGFRARSWDRFLVPAPFARVWVVYGPAIVAGAIDSEEALRRVTDRVERGLVEAEDAALAYAAGRAAPERALLVPA
jgi:lysophospholipid acyltransferase (LPLAT)-like uncharacterized protein